MYHINNIVCVYVFQWRLYSSVLCLMPNKIMICYVMFANKKEQPTCRNTRVAVKCTCKLTLRAVTQQLWFIKGQIKTFVCSVFIKGQIKTFVCSVFIKGQIKTFVCSVFIKGQIKTFVCSVETKHALLFYFKHVIREQGYPGHVDSLCTYTCTIKKSQRPIIVEWRSRFTVRNSHACPINCIYT